MNNVFNNVSLHKRMKFFLKILLGIIIFISIWTFLVLLNVRAGNGVAILIKIDVTKNSALNKIKLYRINLSNNSHEIAKSRLINNVWIIPKNNTQKLHFVFQNMSIDYIKKIYITVGDKAYVFNKNDFLAKFRRISPLYIQHSVRLTTVYEAPSYLKNKRSIIKTFNKLINWNGDYVLFITTFFYSLALFSVLALIYIIYKKYDKIRNIVSKKPVAYSAIISILIAALCYISLSINSGNNLYGNFYYSLWPSEKYSPPEYLKKGLKISPFFSSLSGWDGQFYYYVANDIFISNIENFKHLDTPSYRYQRIGLPLTARFLGFLTLNKYVTAHIFLITNILLFCLGVFFAAKLLIKYNIKLLWLLPWILNCGLQSSILHGLPDPAADGLFIAALFFLLDKKYAKYIIFMSLACLTRETYVLIAGIITALAFFGCIEKEYRFKIVFPLKLSVPVVVFVTWYLFIYYKTGLFPFQQSGETISLPFITYIKRLYTVIKNKNITEFIFLNIYISALLLTLYFSVKKAFKNKILWFIPFYSLLLTSFGLTVLSHFRDYMKGISILFIIIPFLAFSKGSFSKRFKQLTSVFLIIAGALNFTAYINLEYLTMDKTRIPAKYVHNLSIENNANQLENYSSTISLVKRVPYKETDTALQKLFTPYYEVIYIKIKNNTTGEIFFRNNNKNGLNAVYVNYTFLNTSKEKSGYILFPKSFNILPSNISPGKDIIAKLLVRFPKAKSNYKLRISLIQNGFWFSDRNTGYMDIDIKNN